MTRCLCQKKVRFSLASLPALLILLSACAHPTAPSPALDAPPIVTPRYILDGNNGELCVSGADFYPSWLLTVTDAGPGLTLRALMRVEPSHATCDAAAFTGAGFVTDLRPYGPSTYTPRAEGATTWLLPAPTCGRVQYELWSGATRIGVTRAAAGRPC